MQRTQMFVHFEFVKMRKKNTRLILDSFFKLKIKYKDGFSFHVTFKFMQMAEWTN